MWFLNNWKLALGGVSVIILLSLGLYISHLRNNLQEAEDERDKFKVAAESAQSYITIYEKQRKMDQDKIAELLSMAESVPDDVCTVPPELKSIISRL